MNLSGIYYFPLSTMHYIFGYDIYASQACVFECFGGHSLCKKAPQAIGEYIPRIVKNLHVYIFVIHHGTKIVFSACM